MIAYSLAKKVADSNKKKDSSSQQQQQYAPPPQQFSAAPAAAQASYNPRSSAPAVGPSTEVRDGEVLLKVRRNDMHALNGVFGGDNSDFAGTVVAVPPTETKWRVGDRIGARH